MNPAKIASAPPHIPQLGVSRGQSPQIGCGKDRLCMREQAMADNSYDVEALTAGATTTIEVSDDGSGRD